MGTGEADSDASLGDGAVGGDAAAPRDGSTNDPGPLDSGGDAAGPDAGLNACGGEGALQFEGAAASPGDACGECGEGALVCDGTAALSCVGDTAEGDGCDACVAAAERVGEACGECGDGSYVCDGARGTVCEGASEPNACGGCDVLAGEPGAACNEGAPGMWRCAADRQLTCVPEDENVCGGTEDLEAPPGAACGSCGDGVYVCDGGEDVACEDGDGTNGCGGCSLLPELGAACGSCGDGVYVCAGTDGVRCADPGLDACGGCSANDAQPGDECDSGQWLCEGTSLVCGADGLNVCGGQSVLVGAPGDPCGNCGDGSLRCSGNDTLSCVGASTVNECGGCGALAHAPGAGCGPDDWAWACSDGELVCAAPDARTVVELTVSPDSLSVSVGGSAQLTVVARYDDDSEEDVTDQATWESEDGLVSVDDEGVLEAGNVAGQDVVTVEYGERTATVDVSVLADSRSLRVSPTTLQLVEGESESLALVLMDGDSEQDVSGLAAWSSDDDGVATVSGGDVNAVGGGEARITARYDGLQATATVEVTAADTVTGLVISGGTSVDYGGELALTATASLANGSEVDVTASASWSSSATDTATVSAGTVSAVAEGDTTITAAYMGQEATLQVSVGAPALTGITVVADGAELSVGGTLQLRALAAYEDDSSVDVSLEASWSLTPADLATVSETGLLSASVSGTVTARADFGGQFGTLAVVISPAVDRIEADCPTSFALGTGARIRCEATIYLTNGSVDTTRLPVWESGDSAVLDVAADGWATARGLGSTRLSASLGGQQWSASVRVGVSMNGLTAASGQLATWSPVQRFQSLTQSSGQLASWAPVDRHQSLTTPSGTIDVP